jgi:hypothetical protein
MSRYLPPFPPAVQVRRPDILAADYDQLYREDMKE